MSPAHYLLPCESVWMSHKVPLNTPSGAILYTTCPRRHIGPGGPRVCRQRPQKRPKSPPGPEPRTPRDHASGPAACPTAAAATPPQGALSSGPRQKKVGTNPCQVRISLHAERQLAHDPHQAQFCNPARHGWGLPGNRDRRGWAPSGPSRPPAGSRARRRRLTARARTGRSTSVPSAAPQQIQT